MLKVLYIGDKHNFSLSSAKRKNVKLIVTSLLFRRMNLCTKKAISTSQPFQFSPIHHTQKQYANYLLHPAHDSQDQNLH